MRYDPATNRWFKYTIPGHSGFTVDWDGTGPPALRMATQLEWKDDTLVPIDLIITEAETTDSKP